NPGFAADMATQAELDAETSARTAADLLLVPLTQKGAANGVASLDSSGHVPTGQLPIDVMEYQGAWNASINSPTLADGTGNTGDTYRVSTGGTRNLGSGAITFAAGDFIVYSGTVWQRVSGSNAVSSVAGRTGDVVLAEADI